MPTRKLHPSPARPASNHFPAKASVDIPVRRVDIALRNAAAFPKFFVDSPAGWLQSLRTHRHNSILYRQRESLRALLAKPEVFNLAEARIAVRRRRCPSLDVEYAA